MSLTARALIIRAYEIAGIVSRDFQSTTGGQITDGLGMLNDVLAEKGMTGALIPYYREYTFNAVVAQEKYEVDLLMEIESLTFNIGPLRYPMQQISRRKYYGSARPDNIQSLPYHYHMERRLNGADVYLYFLPDQAYPMRLWGKFQLDEIVSLSADLLLIYDRFFLKYLTYAVAADICDSYERTMPTQAAHSMQILEEKLTYISPIDLTTQKYSSFQRDAVINYGDANLGKGWRP